MDPHHNPMEHTTCSGPTSTSPEPSAAMRWAVRIFVTLFTLPFFAVGFGMIGGGGILGGFGWFGVLFGVAFVAVPALMLMAVWFGMGKKPAMMAERLSRVGSAMPPEATVACKYCGRQRSAVATACPSCGA